MTRTETEVLQVCAVVTGQSPDGPNLVVLDTMEAPGVEGKVLQSARRLRDQRQSEHEEYFVFLRAVKTVTEVWTKRLVP
jgi:hypothetical protein